MKIDKGRLENMDLTARQANAVEERIRSIIKEYGFKPYRYISNKIITAENTKNRLEREIGQKEAELESLRNKYGKK